MKLARSLPCLALASLLALPGHADDRHVSVLVYNTAFVSASLTEPGPLPSPVITLDSNEGLFGMDYEERAARIADAILAADDDVVVLNEVFSDDAREILVAKLAPHYPSYLRRIAGDPVFEIPGAEAADSGLMLFSKHPFVGLSQETSPPQELGVTGSNQGQPWGGRSHQVATVKYDCAFLEQTIAGVDVSVPTADCLASKGAALVKIKTGPIYEWTVVLTHLQASYADSDSVERAVRASQLADVRRLVFDSLTFRERRSRAEAPILFAGDLNIVGDNRPSLGTGSVEWGQQFGSFGNPSMGYFAAEPWTGTEPPREIPRLLDAWAWETSPTDPGITNEDDDARLDYLLRKEVRAWCMHRASLALELDDGNGGNPLSDHRGVRFDFGRGITYCSPRRAAVVEFGDYSSPQDIVFGPNEKARLDEGGMQWFLIPEAGSYSISTGRSDVAFEVFAADDLSQPLPSYHSEVTEWGLQYSMQDPPYYVRAFSPGSAHIGGYTISFHQHRCKDRFDACVLEAGYPTDFEWPTNNLVPPDHALWFKFFSAAADSGELPDVSFLLHAQPTWAHQDVALELVDDQTPPSGLGLPELETGHDMVPPGGFAKSFSRYRPTEGVLTGKDDGSPQRYFLLTRRDPAEAHVAIVQTLLFETDLTYLLPQRLRCLVQNTDVGDDDAWLRLVADAETPSLSPCFGGTCEGPIWLDTGQQKNLAPWFGEPVRFLRHVVPNLWEDEASEYLGPWTPVDDLYLEALGRWQGGAKDSGLGWFKGFRWRDGPNGDEASYWYSLDHVLAHEAYYVE